MSASSCPPPSPSGAGTHKGIGRVARDAPKVICGAKDVIRVTIPRS